MAFRGRHFDSGDDEKAVDRQPVFTDETFLAQILDAVVGVVIGEGKTVEAFGAGRGDILLRAGNAVARKERMRVQVDLEGHGPERSLRATKWKASVSRSGRWFARRWATGGNRSSCAKAGSRKGAMGFSFGTASFFSSRLSSTSSSGAPA